MRKDVRRAWTALAAAATIALASPVVLAAPQAYAEGGAQVRGGIVDIDTQYTQKRFDEVVALKSNSVRLTAWKNDVATTQIALAAKDADLADVSVKTTDFTAAGGSKIPASAATATFVRSTKAYNGKFLGYGSTTRPVPEATEQNRSESSDVLYTADPTTVKAGRVQPVWFEVNVPKDAKAGTYTGHVTVSATGATSLELTVELEVMDAVLPDPSEFKDGFDVELWQYPYTSAEYYGVEPFSKEHFDILRSNMELYKGVGGHAITTTINEDAWSGQTYSKNDIHYPSMVKWIKNADGSFTYDYTDFDAWVSFCRNDLKIGDKIVIYSIAPWHNSFTYWENGKLVKKPFTPGSAEYKKIWGDFLADLIDHLMEKGWFDDAYIGIDERGFSNEAFDMIESVRNINDRALKTAGAMDSITNPSKYKLAMRVDDLNVGDFAAEQAGEKFDQLLAEREALGLRTTLYSCTEHQPGNFSLSAPVESYWSIINAGQQTAGFLRWAYDAWTVDPLNDTTHNAFEPGDCFLIFPGEKGSADRIAKRSVRLAEIGEGVRDVNKLRVMEREVPALKADIDAMYGKMTQKATKNTNNYMSAEQVKKLAGEVNTFRADLDTLTKKYIDLKKSGSATIESVTIEGGDATVMVGATKKLTATVAPANALDPRVEWSSSNNKVASVNAKGELTGVKAGTAKITATSKADKTKSATITVTVERMTVDAAARLAYYSFDADSAADSWGKNNGTVNGASFAVGKAGHALKASASKNVTLPNNLGLGENDAWTISYWVKSDGALTDRVSVLMDAGKDFSFDLKMASTRGAGMHVGKGAGDVLTFKHDFKAGEWYHVAWTQSKQAGLSNYVNGKLVETNAWTKSHRVLAPLGIVGGTGFDGLIDELKVYNRVLTQQEIAADMALPGLNIAETAKDVYIGDTYQISYDLVSDAADKTVTFTSSDPKVATVDAQGVVTGKSRGEAIVTVENKAAGYKETVAITVKKKVDIKSTIPMYNLGATRLSDVEKEPKKGGPRQYLGQPDMIRTKTGRLITAFPVGHGKGPLVMKVSEDNGQTWTEKKDLPKSWAGSQETPTMFALSMADGHERLMLITACPGWGTDSDGNSTGWNTSYSDDNGDTWTEYRHFWSNREDGTPNKSVVGMASLVQLQDKDGKPIQKWMGVYHDLNYVNYRTYLTFDKDGNEQWSAPEPYLSQWRAIESKYQMCEIGMFRAPDGKKIVGLARSQSHNNPATLIYSEDEGKTWSKPMDLPGSLAGERHKAAYDPVSGRLVITFREIRYDLNNNGRFDGNADWTCGEWVAWVGTFDQLMNQEQGEYRIMLCEDFSGANVPGHKSGDTGYAGVVTLPDGTFVMDSYGHWDKEFSSTWLGGVTTDLCYIKQAKFKLADVENANKLVDYKALEDAVAKAEKVDRNAWTSESLAKMDKVLADAKEALTAKNIQQVEVAAKAKALNEAVDALVPAEPEPELTFPDVTDRTEHRDDIYWLARTGVTAGFPDGTFRPYASVTRCDMAAFLYRLVGEPDFEPTAEQKARFKDVDAGTDHAKEIWWLAAQEISTGFGDGTFRPMDTVKRQDMAAFLHRLSQKYPAEKGARAAGFGFADVTAGTPHAEDIAWLAATGVSEGWQLPGGGREFRGMSDVARGDMAAFLHRMDDKGLVHVE